MIWTVIGLALLGALLGIDVYLATNGVRGDTWSELLRTWGKYTPFIPWVWAVLLGHWFHPESWKPALLGQPNSVAVLIWLTFALVLGGLAASQSGHPIPSWTVIPFGILVGALLWPV